ncbi:response regulator [Mesorhizobium sp. M0590]|uniref:response regulator n=1 Tax=Mesorhizobium sp. M0590 TaxID=2956966 RepID=UPI003337DC25
MSKRILMVEDTEDNRQIIRDLIATTEYELIEAADGAAGIAAAGAHRPDLILMDIQLVWYACSSMINRCGRSPLFWSLRKPTRATWSMGWTPVATTI